MKCSTDNKKVVIAIEMRGVHLIININQLGNCLLGLKMVFYRWDFFTGGYAVAGFYCRRRRAIQMDVYAVPSGFVLFLFFFFQVDFSSA